MTISLSAMQAGSGLGSGVRDLGLGVLELIKNPTFWGAPSSDFRV